MTTRRERICAALQKAFSPESLEVIDESHHHEGHGGWSESGETHFRIRIKSAAFDGKSRLSQHRLVNDVLKDELQGGLHALAIEAQGSGVNSSGANSSAS